MMNISTSKDTVRVIKQGEPDWMFQRGLVLSPRAAVKISPRCPSNIAYEIQYAIEQGWIKLEAYLPETEFAWEQLQK